MSRLSSLFVGTSVEEKGTPLKDKKNEHKENYAILLVDDEPNVLRALKRIFKQENYKVYLAESGKDALEILKSSLIHVVVSDHRMPGMTGAELLKTIKKNYPQTIRIMLTGYADVNAVMGAVNEGAVYKFITKPWNDEDLRLTISLALEQYDLIKENRDLKKKQVHQQKEIKQLNKFVNSHRSQIGKLLLKKKKITQETYDKITSLQAKTGKIMNSILTELGIIDEKSIIKTIQSEMNINRVSPSEFSVSPAITTLIPKEICKKNILIPLKKRNDKLIVAMADPTDYVKVDDLKFISGLQIEAVIASVDEINKKIIDVYGDGGDLDAAITEIDLVDPTEAIEIILDEEDESTDLDELLISKDNPPAIRIVNAIISDAMRHNASDVHIEPKTKYVMVRYRIDGLLQDKIHIPIAMHPLIISRIKVMAELDIAERRRPQDGRVTVKTSSRMVDMRLSTLPTINGEKIVLRLLDRNASIKHIGEIGLSPSQLETVLKFITNPQGCILTTGPTGSGKTSTLYSLLEQNATISKNYTTIEDPVEYYMGKAEQVMIKEKIGLTFPIVLRTLLRQDPDVIMLGEIRDYETAEVAFHAALTGHMVLSTLHTNSCIATITRLRDIGIKPYVISDALTGIIAQRLVRRICIECSEDDMPDKKMVNALSLHQLKEGLRAKKGGGCSNCNLTGYIGRIALFEVFSISDEIKRLIHKDASEDELKQAAKNGGMKTLYEDGIEKIQKGLTTCEEVLRVLGVQNIQEHFCPYCAEPIKEKYKFCPYCAREILLFCSGCNRLMEPDWNACPSCGKIHAKG